jgi:hypothetical protein
MIKEEEEEDRRIRAAQTPETSQERGASLLMGSSDFPQGDENSNEKET